MQKSIGFRGVFQEGLSPTYGGDNVGGRVEGGGHGRLTVSPALTPFVDATTGCWLKLFKLIAVVLAAKNSATSKAEGSKSSRVQYQMGNCRKWCIYGKTADCICAHLHAPRAMPGSAEVRTPAPENSSSRSNF